MLRIKGMEPSPAPVQERITLEYNHHPDNVAREFQMVIRDDRYQLSLPLSEGMSRLTSDGKLLHDGRVFPGMMRLASPGEEVRGVIYTPTRAILLNIPGAHLRAKLREVSPNHQRGEVCFVNALLRPKAQVQQLGRVLVQTNHFDPKHAQLFVDGMTDSLLAFLFFHHRLDRATSSGKTFSPPEFERVTEFADAHMEESLDLTTWAAVLAMSASEFTRRFQRTVALAPYAWFMERRIEQAKRLLRGSKYQIGDIALRVGFSSQSHFTEAFRRRVGTSPARWRQEQAS